MEPDRCESGEGGALPDTPSVPESGEQVKRPTAVCGGHAGADFLCYGTEDKGYESPADVDRSNGKLVMATNAAFEPYEYYENDKIVGVDADFAKAIADKLGMELTINDMEFDSIIAAVDSGKADFGAAGMTVTDERKQQVDFSDSYYTGKQMIIVKK